jgi:hypothetical protein
MKTPWRRQKIAITNISNCHQKIMKNAKKKKKKSLTIKAENEKNNNNT